KEKVSGRPPDAPRARTRSPLTARVPPAAIAKSRSASQRRHTAASRSRTATVPNDPPIQNASTSHRTPCGGGLNAPAITSSGRELDRTARTEHTVARTATASRTPSDPRRRRWPSPSGAKTSERQSWTGGLATATGPAVTERRLTATGHPALWARQDHQRAKNRAFLALAP